MDAVTIGTRTRKRRHEAGVFENGSRVIAPLVSASCLDKRPAFGILPAAFAVARNAIQRISQTQLLTHVLHGMRTSCPQLFLAPAA